MHMLIMGWGSRAYGPEPEVLADVSAELLEDGKVPGYLIRIKIRVCVWIEGVSDG